MPRDPSLIGQIAGVEGADIEAAYVQGPGHRLELIQYVAPEDRRQVEAKPCDTGFAHLAFNGCGRRDRCVAGVRLSSDQPARPHRQRAECGQSRNLPSRPGRRDDRIYREVRIAVSPLPAGIPV